VWAVLHAERGWRPWLDCVALMGATYWLPVLLDPLVRDDRDSFIPLSLILYALVGVAVAMAPAIGLLLLPVRWISGWRLHTPGEAQPFKLSGVFLLTTLLAGHLMAFLPGLQNMVKQSNSPFDDVEGWVIVLLVASAVCLLTMASAALIIGGRVIVPLLLLMVPIGVGLALMMLSGQDWQALRSVLIAAAAFITHNLLVAFALRCFGYRFTGRRERMLQGTGALSTYSEAS
jgi:hypothetical protein